MRFTDERDLDRGHGCRSKFKTERWTAAKVTGGGGDIGMASDLCCVNGVSCSADGRVK